VLAPCGYYKEDTLRALARARLPRGWHELPAVRDGRVWAVDATSYFSRPGPRVVEGAEILLRVIHSDVFGEPEEAEAVRVPADAMLVEEL
jgi:iron complex transport system substrate-binding protein